MQYPSERIQYKHYGKNLELLVEKAVQIEDEKKKEEAIIYLGRLMKFLYMNWNRDSVDDEKILQHLHRLSRGTLTLPLARVQAEGLFYVPSARLERSGGTSRRHSSSGGYKGSRNKKRKKP